jgi:hypothetical protein
LNAFEPVACLLGVMEWVRWPDLKIKEKPLALLLKGLLIVDSRPK